MQLAWSRQILSSDGDNLAMVGMVLLDELLKHPQTDIVSGDGVAHGGLFLRARLDLVGTNAGTIRQQARTDNHVVTDGTLALRLGDLLEDSSLHDLLVLVRHLEHPVVHGHHGDGEIALLVTDAGGAERHEGRLRTRQAVQGANDGGDGILADGRVVESWLQRVGEQQLASNAGDDNVNVGSVADESLLDGLNIGNVASGDLEVCGDGRVRDLAFTE